MSIKTLALPLFSGPEAEWLATAGCEFARALGAHVIAVHPSEPVMVYSMGLEPIVLPAYEDWQRQTATGIEAAFEKAARLSGVASEYRAQSSVPSGAETYMLSCLRGADLVVMATEQAETDTPSVKRLRAQAIRQSGRPVLLMPKAAPLAGPARKLLIGWSDTREASRAAHDALALAEDGAEVELLLIGRSARTEGSPAGSREDLAAALDRRGYRVSLVDHDPEGSDIGPELMDIARRRGSDLVVTGAFGHSQLYDFVIGAVTSHLLESTDIPVLLSK